MSKGGVSDVGNEDQTWPLPHDIFKLQDHLKKELKSLDFTEYSFSTYRRAEVLAHTRLLMFSKRSGEIEAVTYGYLSMSS